jgi:hypothetical protein
MKKKIKEEIYERLERRWRKIKKGGEAYEDWELSHP